MNVFFFCSPPGPPDNTGYEHQIIALAEGLLELGFTPKGNVNYWLRSTEEGDYLINRYEYTDLNEFDVVVFSNQVINFQGSDYLPDDLFNTDREYKLVFLDSSDGLKTPGFNKEFRNADFVLKSHYCSKYSYPENFVPWQFGLSNRVINYTQQDQVPFNEREELILSNFRVWHISRKLVEIISEQFYYDVYPKDEATESFEADTMADIDLLFWKQTGRRHYPSYYNRLNRTMISNATGGTLQKKEIVGSGLYSRLLRKLDSRFSLLKYDRIYQFDSWRLWESLVAGCCTLHLDFEKYGMELPVNPVNGLHYIGIDLDNPKKVLNILKDKERLSEISENGKNWALQFYSPKAVTERFLALLEE